MDLLLIIGFLIFWLLLQYIVLPRLDGLVRHRRGLFLGGQRSTQRVDQQGAPQARSTDVRGSQPGRSPVLM